MMLDKEIEVAQAQRSAAGASRATKVNLSEKLGELNAEKTFTKAGYQKPGLTGDLKRIPANGGNVRQGIDQGYRSVKPFAGTDAVVEAKGLARPPSNAADALKTDVQGMVEGSANWNIDRLRSAANSGNVNAQKMLARLAGDAPESFLATTNVTTGQTTISRLQGAAGTPIATPIPALPNVSPVGSMVGTTGAERVARSAIQDRSR
jgi:hypothetical protein